MAYKMTVVGDGINRYEVDRDWLRKKPEFWSMGECADVAVDSHDRLWPVSYTHLTLPTNREV